MVERVLEGLEQEQKTVIDKIITLSRRVIPEFAVADFFKENEDDEGFQLRETVAECVLEAGDEMCEVLMVCFSACYSVEDFDNIISLAKAENSRGVLGVYANAISKLDDQLEYDLIEERVADIDMESVLLAKSAMVHCLKRGLLPCLEALNTQAVVPQTLAAKTEAEINFRCGLERALLDFFEQIGDAFKGGSINLSDYKTKLMLILKILDDPEEQGLLKQKLLQAGALRPVPELHWTVDRTLSEYERRLGIDVDGIIQDFIEDDSVQGSPIILEPGHGNGTCRDQIETQFEGKVLHFGVSESLNYPIAPLIEKLVDWDKLELTLNLPLSDKDKEAVSDYWYKVLLIKNEEIWNENFTYDEQVRSQLTEDPATILALLPQKVSGLSARSLPSRISARKEDGSVYYPHRIGRPEGAAGKALNMLAQEPDKYLRQDAKVMELLPAFPNGTMIAKFEELEKLESDQIDLFMACRSTVYMTGDKYQDLLKTVYEKLSPNGLIIDDSIRDNDGWYYRLAEMKQVQDDLNTTCYVICGPGFEDEDHNQEDVVPLSVVISKSGDVDQQIKNRVREGCELRKLDEILEDKNYLGSLDRTGKVRESVEALENPLLAA